MNFDKFLRQQKYEWNAWKIIPSIKADVSKYFNVLDFFQTITPAREIFL